MNDNGIKLHVTGSRALFTRPETAAERVSYEVMTPTAARGLLSAIYWKPGIEWVVERIHVFNPIRFASIKRNEVKNVVAPSTVNKAMTNKDVNFSTIAVEKSRQQRSALILRDVSYIIDAHIDIVDAERGGDNVVKHLEIFRRRAAKGQAFKNPCLGCREFPADFQLIQHHGQLPTRPNDVQTPELGFGHKRDLGRMIHSIGHDYVGVPRSWFSASLVDGVMEIPPITLTGATAQ